MRMLMLSYIIQQVIPNVCTKFQNPSRAVLEKSLPEKKKVYTQTNIVMEKTKTIYPLYAFYARGIRR